MPKKPIECKKTAVQIKKAKLAAGRAVDKGDNEVLYRRRFFTIEDNPRGWTYFFRGDAFNSLDAVTTAIDDEVKLTCRKR
jgi:hypothetical protein